MTQQKAGHLQNILDIKAELFRLTDGMDYCLDWKPDSDSWSVREVIYHLVDTPIGGIHRLIDGIMSGNLGEFDLEPDLLNVTPDRLTSDIDQLRQEIAHILGVLEETVSSATEDDFAGKSILAHLKAHGRDEARTVESLLQGLFARHWRAHLEQIASLRESLGM